MASFVGTLEEFKRYLGPRFRVLVQQFTRKYKSEIAACQHCESTEFLESAHVHGRDRVQIIESILEQYTNNGLITIDLSVFEGIFKNEHYPIEKSILILCRSCHQIYDSPKTVSTNLPAQSKGLAAGVNRKDKLPITLSPSIPEDFKRLLLVKRLAKIEVWYQDGTVEEREWNAVNFKDTSNVMGNLRSRPEFRPGAWQELGIVKVHAKIEQGSQ